MAAMRDSIAIIGGSGVIGAPTIARLVSAGSQLRVLSSSESSAEALRKAGVAETVVGDFHKADDLGRVLNGARSLLYVPKAMQGDEAEIGKAVVAAAVDAKVDHVAYVSCYHSPVSALAHHHHKLLVEEALMESGLEYTILQPSMFMQNLGFIWRDVAATGIMRWPWLPSRRFNLVDVEDLADVLTRALLTPDLRGGSFEICGPETISVEECAAKLSAAWGRAVRAEQFDPDQWAAGMRAAGMSEWGIGNFRNMSRHYDQHGLTGGNPLVLEAILGRKATRYEEFLARFLASVAAA